MGRPEYPWLVSIRRRVEGQTDAQTRRRLRVQNPQGVQATTAKKNELLSDDEMKEWLAAGIMPQPTDTGTQAAAKINAHLQKFEAIVLRKRRVAP